MPKISLDNLERYDGHLKDWCDVRFASKNVNENWNETEEAGAVAFYPVPDTEIHPIVKFSFKEIPPANGDKSPSNPSTINGVTSVSIKHVGKNIAVIRSTRTMSGITITSNNDGTYIVNGTATANVFFPLTTAYSNDRIQVKQGEVYSISGCPSNGSYETFSTYLSLINSNTNAFISSAYDVGSGCVYTIPQNGNIGYYINIKTGTTVNNLLFKPQLEFNNVITEFEQPVLNNYNILLNDTYYGGEVDLATGIMAITNKVISLTSDTYLSTSLFDEYTESYSVGFYPSPERLRTIPVNSKDYGCSILPAIRGGVAHDISCIHCADNSMNIRIQLLKTDLNLGDNVSANDVRTAIHAWLGNHPGTLVYPLLTPQIIQLSPLQIKSLTQSDLYTPKLNTVYTDADAVKVRYQKSPIVTSSDIDNAILSLGGD